MTQQNPLQLQIRADGRLLAAGSQDPRALILDIHCAEAPAAAPRAPLAVMLAVDVSGSMTGPKLDAVRAAGARVLAGLHAQDLLGVCSFAGDPRLLLPLTAMDDAGRAAAATQFAQLRADGNTALCAGWRLAAEQLMQEDARLQGRTLHVIVVSDGMGNAGETRPPHLAEFAASIALRGISTSAIGIGDDWSSDQLEALAMAGGGRLHHALAADEIAALLAGEMRGLHLLAAAAMELAVAVPAGCRAQVFAPETSRFEGGELRLRLGAMLHGGRRAVVMLLEAGQQAGPGPWVVEATLSARHPATQAPLPVAHAVLRLDAAPDAPAARQARDAAVARIAAEHWLADATRRVMNANRLGEVDQMTLAAEARRFADFCRGIPETERLVAALSSLAERAATAWSEAQRKLSQMASFKQSRGESVLVARMNFINTLEQMLDADPEEGA